MLITRSKVPPLIALKQIDHCQKRVEVEDRAGGPPNRCTGHRIKHPSGDPSTVTVRQPNYDHVGTDTNYIKYYIIIFIEWVIRI